MQDPFARNWTKGELPKPSPFPGKELSWLNEICGSYTPPPPDDLLPELRRKLTYVRSEAFLADKMRAENLVWSAAHAHQTRAIRELETIIQLEEDLDLYGVSYLWIGDGNPGKAERLNPLAVVEGDDGYRPISGYTFPDGMGGQWKLIPKDHVYKRVAPIRQIQTYSLRQEPNGSITHTPISYAEFFSSLKRGNLAPVDPPLNWLNEDTVSCFGLSDTPPKDRCPDTTVRAYKAEGKVFLEVPTSIFNEAEGMGLVAGWVYLKDHVDRALSRTHDPRLHAIDSQRNEHSMALVSKVMVVVASVTLATRWKAEGIRVSIEEPSKEAGLGIFDFGAVAKDPMSAEEIKRITGEWNDSFVGLGSASNGWSSLSILPIDEQEWTESSPEADPPSTIKFREFL